MPTKKEKPKKTFDKTNTCQVSTVVSKKNGKRYVLFSANVKGLELSGLINKRDGLLRGELREKPEETSPRATVILRKNATKSLNAPVYTGTIEGKGNSFEVALWERFGVSAKGEYHFWSGLVKTPESNGKFVDHNEDEGNDFLLDFNEAKKLREDHSQAPPEGDGLPF